MFSPYYAWSGRGDPENHCALNVALSGARSRWTMTERGRASLSRDAATLAIGPSRLSWDGRTLTIAIDEVSAPLPARVRGEVRFTPGAPTGEWMALDAEGRHAWRPIAPNARVAVDLDAPAMRWSGTGYLDANRGEEPLERAFRRWDWCRIPMGERTAVLYDMQPCAAEPRMLALMFDPVTGITTFPPPPRIELAASKWRVPRSIRSEEPAAARVTRTLLDAPFYARSLVETQLSGQRVTALHESLSLDRLTHPVVRAMLPFRMPRRAW